MIFFSNRVAKSENKIVNSIDFSLWGNRAITLYTNYLLNRHFCTSDCTNLPFFAHYAYGRAAWSVFRKIIEIFVSIVIVRTFVHKYCVKIIKNFNFLNFFDVILLDVTYYFAYLYFDEKKRFAIFLQALMQSEKMCESTFRVKFSV